MVCHSLPPLLKIFCHPPSLEILDVTRSCWRNELNCLWNQALWGMTYLFQTRSKAFSRSKKIVMLWSFWLKASVTSWVSKARLSFVDRFLVQPIWYGEIKFSKESFWLILRLIILSKSLHKQLVRLIGLVLFGFVKSLPTLGIKTKRDFLHSSGNVRFNHSWL